MKEPWRVARSYLRDVYGADIPAIARPGVQESQVALVDALLERRVSTVETSSAGRLFDAVAALLGLRDRATFEGQAAMRLEAIAESEEHGSYEFALRGDAPVEVDLRAVICGIVEGRMRRVETALISARFHSTLIQVIVKVCGRIRDQSGLTRVCLSGGCSQNLRLLIGAVERLREMGFEVYFHFAGSGERWRHLAGPGRGRV